MTPQQTLTGTQEKVVQPKTEKQTRFTGPHLRKVVVLLILFVLFAGLAYFVWQKFFAGPTVPDNVVVLSGRIEGDDSAVAPKAGGRIVEIRVREGDTVAAGETIAILSDEQRDARKAMAQAALTQAMAQQQVAQAQLPVLDQQLRQSEAEVAQQEAAYQLAQFDKEAYGRLAKTGAVSERQGLQAAKVAEQQAATVSAAKLRVAAVQKQIAQQRSQIASATAAIGQFRAQLAEAEENRQDLIVKAPFAGTVMTRSAEPGEVINAGTPVVTLIDLQKVYLRGYVPEGQIGKVKIGQQARIYLDSNPNKPMDAFVARIDPQAMFTPENTYFREDRVKQVFGLKLQLKDAAGYAKPGMPADGEILVSGRWQENRRK